MSLTNEPIETKHVFLEQLAIANGLDIPNGWMEDESIHNKILWIIAKFNTWIVLEKVITMKEVLIRQRATFFTQICLAGFYIAPAYISELRKV